jgi:DNA-binding winged helix-turn-helix (wHTH) protein/tetratricopeptide (TPR) repeat protein
MSTMFHAFARPTPVPAPALAPPSGPRFRPATSVARVDRGPGRTESLRTGAASGGSLELDRSDECVWRNGEKITLAPKAFALLRHLAEHRGRLVTKHDLLDAVWPGVFVGDAVLKVAVREIRAALGDDAREPHIIQTVHRRGYRFIADVRLVDARNGAATPPANTLRLIGGSAAGPAPSGASAPSTLVGRADTLERLRQHLALAMTGARQMVFVTGEPGIGKTSVVDAFLDELRRDSSATAARGQCLELSGAAEAYLPFLDAFGRLLREPRHAGLVGLVRRYAPTWLRQMPSLVQPSDRAALDEEVRGATRERMLREMAEAIEALSAEQPLVLVLEDLHWSDGSTVDLISALARRRESARVLVIGTYRPGDVILDQHPLRAMKQDLQVHHLCSELPLGLLDEADVQAFLDLRLRPHGLPRELAHMLHERTDGNPLFLSAVVAYLIEGRRLRQNEAGTWMLEDEPDAVATGVPDNLRLMVEKQIDRLAPADQRLLEAASIAGVEFPSTAVAAALGLDDVDVEEQCGALARRGQFIESRGLAPLPDRVVERFAFTHSMYQQVFHQRVAPARRARLHLRIGERGEAVYGRAVGDIACELAVHFEQAHDLPRAVKYLRLAAGNAARRSANQEAIACLTRARQLVDNFEERAPAEVRIGLCEQLGLVLRSSGEMSVAASQFLEMAAMASAAGRVDDEARAWLYAASVLSWLDRQRCLRAAERAERLPVTDSLLRAHVAGYAAYARLIWNKWSAEDAETCARTAAITRESGDMELYGFHVGRFVHVQAMHGDYADAALTAQEGLRLAGAAADTYDALMCQFWHGWALLHMGAWGDMRTLIDESMVATERNGHSRLTLLFRLELAWLHEEAGEFEKARQLCELALAEAREVGYAFGELMGQVILGLTHLGLRDFERARQAFEAVDRRLHGERLLMDWIWRMPLAWGIARLELETGHIDAAAARARELVEIAGECGERTWLALGHATLGQIAMAERRWKVAEREIETALAMVVEHGVPLAAWRVHAIAADLHARRLRLDRAGEARRSRDLALGRLSTTGFAQVSQALHSDLAAVVAVGS